MCHPEEWEELEGYVGLQYQLVNYFMQTEVGRPGLFAVNEGQTNLLPMTVEETCERGAE